MKVIGVDEPFINVSIQISSLRTVNFHFELNGCQLDHTPRAVKTCSGSVWVRASGKLSYLKGKSASNICCSTMPNETFMLLPFDGVPSGSGGAKIPSLRDHALELAKLYEKEENKRVRLR